MVKPSLDSLFDSLAGIKQTSTPPLEKWQPAFSGNMDIVIDESGAWYHEGRLIERKTLVKLFASVLRREDDGLYYLVTPVEKHCITVKDSPLLAVEFQVKDGDIHFRTNLDDVLVLGADHPMQVKDDVPRVFVRHGLWAKLTRSVYYQLIECAEEKQVSGQRVLGVVSDDTFHTLGDLD